MKPTPLLLLGGGEHATVVRDAAETDPDRWEFVGVADPGTIAPTLSGLPLFSTEEEGLSRASNAHAVIAIGALGSQAIRRRLCEAYTKAGTSWATIIHAGATISKNATIGEGTVVLAGAVINPGARVGNHCIINSNAVVEHDVEIGDFANIGPGAVIGGKATIGADAYLGLGSLVRDHLAIGPAAVIGMGSVVTAPVSGGTTVFGNPARPQSSNDHG